MAEAERVIDRILDFARNDERVRAVYLDGSRTDPTVTPDSYQDFDVVYVVTDVTSFVSDPGWIRALGTPVIVQEPDKPEYGWGTTEQQVDGYAWLMILDSGVRIDLGMQSVATAPARFLQDRLRQVLMDKDGLLPPAPQPTNEGFWEKRPGEGEYLACCNEFWWCLNNVAKAIAREQYPMAVTHLQDPVRAMLFKILGWYVGDLHGWRISVGKQGKYLDLLLPADDYAQLLKTFPHADPDDLWDAVFAMTALFRKTGEHVAVSHGYRYPEEWDTGMTKFLQAVQRGELPGAMRL